MMPDDEHQQQQEEDETSGADDAHHGIISPFFFGWRSSHHDTKDYHDGSSFFYSEHDTEWDPEHSSYDWWPLSWCCFYVMASFENCCSSMCCGPTVRTRDFPLLYALCIAFMYPVCVMPLSCLLREAAKEKLNIQNENALSTCFQSIFCAPCSLVQVRKTLEAGKPRKFIVKQERQHPALAATTAVVTTPPHHHIMQDIQNFWLKHKNSMQAAPTLLNALTPSHSELHH